MCGTNNILIEFLVAKKESIRNIHKCLCNVYGSAMVNRSTAGHWARRMTASKWERQEHHDLPRSGCPVTAVSPEIKQCSDAIIHEDRCITT
ncbi:hypothetical protein Cfor_11209 [Coptotermes formosanus]|jgi:hypothetical protein|uniref:Mos1 transposase HTH domain-containing protein n=1 Tax=Coptotermes formosanus TaxID=36987 RepID=A0A6L2Q0N4_COPFO|nr:hypothetical protein Cfor_11209 [Coptotermes formosanus]